MALPGHRSTSSKKRRRAAHFALKKQEVSVCPKCRQAVRPHQACMNCGTYAGREVLDLKRKTKRLLKKVQQAKTLAKEALESNSKKED